MFKFLFEQKHDKKYYELNSSVPLRQALTGTHILENPQILIVSPDEAPKYARTPFAPVPLELPTENAHWLCEKYFNLVSYEQAFQIYMEALYGDKK